MAALAAAEAARRDFASWREVADEAGIPHSSLRVAVSELRREFGLAGGAEGPSAVGPDLLRAAREQGLV